MGEIKEKQWAVVKYHIRTDGNNASLGGVQSITWFDAREDARKFASKKNASKTLAKRWFFSVLPMTRGPRA